MREPKLSRVATYARVSTAHHGQNPDVQTHELRRYCDARGWAVAHEIVDHGFSGATDARPGLKELMRLARARLIDVICVVKMDRLFRSLKHLVASLEEFEALGVKFVAVADGIDYSTPQGRLFTQILGSLAEFERALLRERTMMGLAHAKASGTRLGRPRRLDYAQVALLRDQGLSLSQIARRLGATKGGVSKTLKKLQSKGA